MSTAVRFRRIDVRRMPGFPQGGLWLENLAAGVNVVYGPNASGKTTLSRAVQRILQIHDNTRHADSLEAQLDVAGQLCELDLHFGQATYRIGGAAAPVPHLAPAEVGGRYVLALHDLVEREEERDIVQQIVREAAGGYDLPAAAKELDFDRERPSGRKIREYSAYEEAVRDRRKAEERLSDVARKAQELAGLERERQAAEQANARQRVIERALTAFDEREQLNQARRDVADFPQEMSKLVGDEWTKLTDIQADLEQQETQLAAATDKHKQAVAGIRATKLPEQGVPEEVVGTLEKRCDTLEEKAREIAQSERELSGSKQQLERALLNLGAEVSLERAEKLDTATVKQLFKFLQDVDKLRQSAEAAEKLTSWLKTDTTETVDAETLQEGIVWLEQWLAQERTPSPVAGTRLPWLIVAAATGVVALAMSLVHPSWLLLLLPAAGLAAWPLLRPRLIAPALQKPDIPHEWSSLGLPPPADWSPAEVQTLRRRLRQRAAVLDLQQQQAQRFADLQGPLAKYKRQKQQIEQRRDQWRQRLGIDTNIDDPQLYLAAEAIHRIQVAREEVAAKEASVAAARLQHERLLRRINEELKPFVDVEATDADQALAHVKALAQRRQDFRIAVKERDDAEQAIADCKREIAKLQQKRQQIFTAAGLSAELQDDELTLRQWCDRVPEYKKAVQALEFAKRDAGNAQAELAGHEELLDKTGEDLQAELEKTRNVAAKLDDLNREIGGIESRIAEAKKSSDLEAALAREKAALDKLREARDQDAARLVGNVLFQYLERQHRQEQQPGVLKRAVTLFARITHGRYELRVRQGGDGPGFLAYDTALGREQNLEELSSGTRLQLLLAVRVAFVEQQEQAYQLPLIFDETLGNSDEQRAARIIESVVEIARGGRQVFYFTAQHDELAKWRRVLRGQDDVPHEEFDLARQRGFSELEFAPAEIEVSPPPAAPVPSPDGDDWLAYGRRLQVPRPDRRGHVGGVHLWYLVDDVDELHRLLVHDINKWGQLQTLVKFGSADGLGPDSPVYRRAAAAARLLELLFRLWRQGRGMPLDRSVLEDSGAVSDTFIEEVAQLADSQEGDAARLLEALRNGRVARFRTNNIEALEEFLIERGYLDEQPVLSAEEIREKINPLVFSDLEEGLITREHVDQLLMVVTAETPSAGRV